MYAKWGGRAVLALCVALLAGCRTPRPALAPEKTPEQLVEPAPAGRYDIPGFPTEAMDRTGERSTLGEAPKSLVPTGGIGSGSNNRMGPYKF